jgi:hypothetical protein
MGGPVLSLSKSGTSRVQELQRMRQWQVMQGLVRPRCKKLKVVQLVTKFRSSYDHPKVHCRVHKRPSELHTQPLHIILLAYPQQFPQ